MTQVATNITWHEGTVSRQERQQLLNQKGVTAWMTGLSASGKSTIACILEQMLVHKKKHAYRLDGDNIRMGLNNGLTRDQLKELFLHVGVYAGAPAAVAAVRAAMEEFEALDKAKA